MKERLVLDIECYVNYVLIMFKKISSGEVLYFESFNDSEINAQNILFILNKYQIITFNGIKYDKVILEAVIAGLKNKTLKRISDDLIVNRVMPWDVRKKYGFAQIYFDHVDIIEILPLMATLKIYGGRIHTKKMQDLPIEESAVIKKSERKPLRTYCINDLDLTIDNINNLVDEMKLREAMSKDYNVDVRSKSDAQIAEAVIRHEMETKLGITNLKRPEIPEGTVYNYIPPKCLCFKTQVMMDLFDEVKNSDFETNKAGHIKLPKNLHNFKFKIGETTYKFGVGGLHSCEKSVAHVADENYILQDYDVAAYYPNIILKNKFTPEQLGKPFLRIFNDIVKRRLKAKKAGDKQVDASLKITINGTFGKLASKWSFLYAPDLMMQVTITGQLSLLMLIERLELEGISVVSGNTDGIVLKLPPEKEPIVEDIIFQWEVETGYEMECNNYKALYSRDVNNYIAIGDGFVKAIGAYADPHIPKNKFKKNPTNEICPMAVKLFLDKGIPIEDTIYDCKDVTKFVTVRTVNGGAIKENELLGKSIRWYYSCYELDVIRYKTNNNTVPRSLGARPLMELPDELPNDIDYDWYIEECYEILKQIGYNALQ